MPLTAEEKADIEANLRVLGKTQTLGLLDLLRELNKDVDLDAKLRATLNYSKILSDNNRVLMDLLEGLTEKKEESPQPESQPSGFRPSHPSMYTMQMHLKPREQENNPWIFPDFDHTRANS